MNYIYMQPLSQPAWWHINISNGILSADKVSITAKKKKLWQQYYDQGYLWLVFGITMDGVWNVHCFILIFFRYLSKHNKVNVLTWSVIYWIMQKKKEKGTHIENFIHWRFIFKDKLLGDILFTSGYSRTHWKEFIILKLFLKNKLL